MGKKGKKMVALAETLIKKETVRRVNQLDVLEDMFRRREEMIVRRGNIICNIVFSVDNKREKYTVSVLEAREEFCEIHSVSGKIPGVYIKASPCWVIEDLGEELERRAAVLNGENIERR